MKMNRRTALQAGAALAASAAIPAWAQAKPTLRFAAVFSDKDIRADMIRMLAKDIEGDFKLEPFYAGTLFKQGTELVALQRDNLEMSNIAPADISKQIPAWSLLTSAYLFRDANHLARFWSSDLGAQYKKQAEEQVKIKILGPELPDAPFDDVGPAPDITARLGRRPDARIGEDGGDQGRLAPREVGGGAAEVVAGSGLGAV